MKRNKILLISIIFSICLVSFSLITMAVLKKVHSTNNKSNYNEIKIQSDEEVSKQKEVEENFLIVFKKYYGEKETEELFEEIRAETKSNSYDPQNFPKSRREIFLYYIRYNKFI